MDSQSGDKTDSIGPRATIDLSAIKENYEIVSSYLPKNVVVSAVVKSDSYGLGARKISERLYRAGCRVFWVAYLLEAIDLRKVLPFDAQIFYLQGFRESDFDLIQNHSVCPVINSVEEFRTISGHNLKYAVHVDSGLSRLGIRPNELDQIIPYMEGEDIEYVISHLACSEQNDSLFNMMQKESFDQSLSKIHTVLKDVKASISATGGAIIGEGLTYDLVRIGAFLYGIDLGHPTLKPRNVLSLEVSVLQRYSIPRGTTVGYGATYTVDKDEVDVAVLSIGYADGLNRSLSNKGSVGFYDSYGNLYRARIIGRISMDLVVVDVSDIPQELTEAGSKAMVIDRNYSINEMAIDAGTIPYEVLTNLKLKSNRFAISYVV